MDELESWLDLWAEWLDEVLAAGIAHMGTQTRKKIAYWSHQADELGYARECQLATILNSDDALDNRADAFANLIVRHDLLTHLIDIRKLESDIRG